MPLFDRIWFRVRALVGSRDLAREFDREMSFHIAMETEQLLRAGLPPEEAERRARVAFGGRQRFREEARDELRSRGLADMRQDLRHAARTFARTPSFTATVVLTLALGIGGTTVIFSVTDNVVLRPLPYANADRIVAIQTLNDRLRNITPTWPPNAAHFLAWKAGCTLCDGVAAVRATRYMLTGAGDPQVLTGLRVSDDFFSVLGARAQMGRLLAPGDDQPNNRVVVISDRLWRSELGARHDIIGRTIQLNDLPWTVIGVATPGFHVPGGGFSGALSRRSLRVDVFVPLALLPYQRTTAGEHDYAVMALLKPGTTPAALRERIDAINAANRVLLHDETPSRSVVRPLHAQVVGDASRPLVLLLAAVGSVLLIMCVNLANLFLSRSAARRRESAVRLALGASRGRLVRQALTETLALSFAGGAVGVLVARWGLRALIASAPAELPRVSEIQLDPRVLVVSLLVSIAAGLSFGLMPALRFGRTAPGEVLKENSRGASDGRGGARARSWLIASQVGLSVLLLIVAGLLLRSFMRVLNVDKGFTAADVLALNVAAPPASYASRASWMQLTDQLTRELAALPGVKGAGVTNALPLEGEAWVDGLRGESADDSHSANFRFVSPNYFALLGVPVVRGRPFTDADRGQPRLMISAGAATALWPGENPVGRRVFAGSDTAAEVIGIVADVRTSGMEKAASLTVYRPYWDNGYASTLVLATTVAPSSLSGAARDVIRRVAPSVAVSRVRTMGQVIAGSVALRRFELVLIGLFAITALLTVSIGMYGIISHSLSRRAKEIGIRLALGAVPRDVHSMVLVEVLRPVVSGLVAGVAASLIVGRGMSGLLFEVRATDAATLSVVAFTIIGVAVVACWIPARRATRSDLLTTLGST